MSQNLPTGPSKLGPLPPWMVILIFLAILGVSWWQTSTIQQPVPSDQTTHRSNSNETSEDSAPDAEPSRRPVEVEVTPEPQVAPREEKNERRSARIENQTIRSQTGEVVFRGTIDLQPTLDRIEHGGRNTHRNDGTTFQNRERRLPAQASGYYKEYVHPTKGIGGPGPQRVIVGKEGDIWYTPDHYKTFVRIQ